MMNMMKHSSWLRDKMMEFKCDKNGKQEFIASQKFKM